MDGDLFRVLLPIEPGERAAAKVDFFAEVRRVAALVSYQSFSSLEKAQDGSFTLTSRMESGNGFVIVFDPNE